MNKLIQKTRKHNNQNIAKAKQCIYYWKKFNELLKRYEVKDYDNAELIYGNNTIYLITKNP